MLSKSNGREQGRALSRKKQSKKKMILAFYVFNQRKSKQTKEVFSKGIIFCEPFQRSLLSSELCLFVNTRLYR